MFQRFGNSTEKDVNKILEALKADASSGQRPSIGFVDSGDTLSVLASEGQLWQLVTAAFKLEKDRQSRYRDYDEMENDPVPSSGLELIVDDATQYSQEANATLWIEGEYEYKEELNQLFSDIDVENKVWGWVYNLAKYGDFFLGIEVEAGKGITGIRDNEHPGRIYRLDVENKLSGFIRRNQEFASKIDVFGSGDYVHFINNYRPNFETVEVQIKEKDEKTGAEKPVKKKITSMYGTSILQNARRVYKLLNLLEVSLALARLARSPLIRIFYVQTNGMQPDDRRNLMRDIEEKFKARKSFDFSKDFFSQKTNPLTNSDDLFLPVTEGKGDIRAETIGGEVNVKDIVDIEYLRDKLFAALRIPKPYLGFSEPLGMGSGSTLTKLDIRYARMVKKVQRAFIEGVYRLCQIHLSYLNNKEVSVDKLALSMVPISSAEEDSRLENIERKFAIATSMMSFLTGITPEEGTKVDTQYVLKYIVKNILQMPDLDAENIMVDAPMPPEPDDPEYDPENPDASPPPEGAEEEPGSEVPPGENPQTDPNQNPPVNKNRKFVKGYGKKFVKGYGNNKNTQPPEVEALLHKIHILDESKCTLPDIVRVLKEYVDLLSRKRSIAIRPRNKDIRQPTLRRLYGGKQIRFTETGNNKKRKHTSAVDNPYR